MGEAGTIVTRRRIRRAGGVVLAFGLLVVLALVATNLSLARHLGRVDGAFDGLGERPRAAPGETILLVGTRPDDARDVPWLRGEQSVEALMLVEIAAHGRKVRVETLPPDPTLESAVVASSPSSSVTAVEEWSGRRVDHLMALDWGTFAELAAANGLDRTYRYGSSAAVQHDYVRDVLRETLHVELRREPLALYRQLRTTASGLTIDDEWTIAELDWLLISLRNLRSGDIDFSTARPG